MPTPLRRFAKPEPDGDQEIRPCGACLRCITACPTGALQYHDRVWLLDMDRCRFCRECSYVCPNPLVNNRPA